MFLIQERLMLRERKDEMSDRRVFIDLSSGLVADSLSNKALAS